MPLVGACVYTYATCRDRANFAACPLTFGQVPCYADPDGVPCEYSARTCKALGIVRDDFGDSIYANYGGCNHAWAGCASRTSFLPYAPEMRAYCQPRSGAPYEASPYGFNGGQFLWIGRSETTLALGGSNYTLPVLWAARTTRPRLPRTTAMVLMTVIPSKTIVRWMLDDPQATGIGLSNVVYSKGRVVHYLTTAQWIATSLGTSRFAKHMVLNTSADGSTWTGDGLVIKSDESDIGDAGRRIIEYRNGLIVEGTYRHVEGGKTKIQERKILYCLRGTIRSHVTEEEGVTREWFDEMRIDLMADNEACSFSPAIVRDAFIPEWPAEASGQLVDPGNWPVGTLLTTWTFTFEASGEPTGNFEAVIEGGCIQLFVPVNKLLGYDANGQAIVVPVLMRYISMDGVNFIDGTTVAAANGHYMTCANSVPVCRWWDGTKCTIPSGFCGVRANGRYHAYHPACDGQGTAAWDGDEFSRYEPGTTWRGPAEFFRSHITGLAPEYALAGCAQEGQFACKAQQQGYEGQWCAKVNCPGFTPRGLWGSDGIRIMDSLKNNALTG